ncbi:hypothetical protein FU139_12505, partial [Burkholderia territorii]
MFRIDGYGGTGGLRGSRLVLTDCGSCRVLHIGDAARRVCARCDGGRMRIDILARRHRRSRVGQRRSDRAFMRCAEVGNGRADDVFPGCKVDRGIEYRRGRSIRVIPMLAVRITRRCIGLDAGIGHGMLHSLAECRRACIDDRRVRARLDRHECIQHDRCVVVCRRGFMHVRKACVVGRGMMRARCNPAGYGGRCRDRRCCCCRCRCRPRDARCRRHRPGHRRRGGLRRHRIGRPHIVQRRPLRGAGLDRAQRVVNARRRRDRLRGLLHPCVERRARRDRRRGAAPCRVLR